MSVVVKPQLAAQSHSCSLTLLQKDVGENRRVKVRKLVGWYKDILIRKAKGCRNKTGKKRKQRINFSSTLQQQTGVQLFPKEIRALGRQTPYLWMSPLPSHSPSFYGWARHHRGWNISLVHWDELTWLCPLPASCPLYPAHWWSSMRRRKGLQALQNSLVITKTSLCYQQGYQNV